MTPPTRTDAGTESPVRERRKQHRLTQAELGALVDVSRHTVIAIEQGDYAPSVFLALRLARVLDATVEDLFGAHPDATPSHTGDPS
ncbi:helix-turn-helix transcriptional regulator [Georgenia sp. Z1344]|uniref:helix-turn-helix transcriptional regulator n=1 Tax=Georgenia sp. Z1344 TaxID=3416706 RepID=UPI003CFBC1EA